MSAGNVTTTEWLDFAFGWQKMLVPVVNDDGSNSEEERAILVIKDLLTNETHKFHFSEESKKELVQGAMKGVVLPS